jgi:hypothetical protein
MEAGAVDAVVSAVDAVVVVVVGVVVVVVEEASAGAAAVASVASVASVAADAAVVAAAGMIVVFSLVGGCVFRDLWGTLVGYFSLWDMFIWITGVLKGSCPLLYQCDAVCSLMVFLG